MQIAIKRIYEPPADDDGFRALVDRLWPRGISKEKARVDLWAKDVTPSTVLRKWYHDGGDFEEFRRRYRAELEEASGAVDALLEACGERPLTLLFAAKSTTTNHAQVLADYLRERRE